ncbi:hypothetical protein GGI07_004508 [Coemansia sp. Benny D115]|nr:hypothetical protein GGI07_004508 [Coemansia sp. Benny D115]
MHTPTRSSSSADIQAPHSAGIPASPRINDDAAERRRRRKSAIERRRSNLVTPQRLTTKAPLFSRSPQLNSQATFSVQLPHLTPEELNQRYEEWMKIAADNKINANNTWDFALIDYFYDMSLLREGDSINFQKASCTLDGCVKIYSSRVDSVASETGRLLSGLAETPGTRGSRRGDGGDGDGEGGGKQKPRRAGRTANTLAKDFASISVKKLDLEFSVDPLFKKTSADFDEGGARGLLLNHLAFDSDGKIVFDASDSRTPGENDDAMVDGDSQASEPPVVSSRYRASLIDLSSMDAIFDGIMQHLDGAEICPSLADFEFTRDTSLDFSLLREHFKDDGNSSSDGRGASSEPADSETAGSIGGDFGDDGDDGDDMDHFLNFDDAEDGPVPIETASTLLMTEQREEAEQDEIKGETGAAHGFAMPGAGHMALAMAEGEDNLLSYFDTKLSKGWAGPEHWRLPISRAAMQKQMGLATAGDEQAAGAEDADGGKRKRADKQVYYTDFLDGADVSAKVLFAKPVRASVIAMSKKAALSQDHTLPEDVHFSSKNLFNLLLKPRLKFNPRRARTMVASAGAAGAAAATAAASGAAGGGGGDSYGGFVVDGDDSGQIFGALGEDGPLDRLDDGPIGFDDGDDFDDDMAAAAAAAADEKPGIPQLRLIKPLYVNYARRAKRVNVKRLKDNIWREMAVASARESTGLDTAAEMAGGDVKLEGTQRFSEVLGNLRNVYPREKLEELSVSYCFICLLHLANERNLRIVGDASLQDLVISQDRFD